MCLSVTQIISISFGYQSHLISILFNEAEVKLFFLNVRCSKFYYRPWDEAEKPPWNHLSFSSSLKISLNNLFHKVTYLHRRRFLFSFDFFVFISALVEVAFYSHFQQGAINLQNASIEKTEEGRGRSCFFLRSHAAPPLWKCASKSVISARDRSIPGTGRCL